MFRPTKILAPTDFSEHSDRALAEAFDLARQYKAKVYVLHVVREDIHHCAGDYCLSDDLLAQLEKNMLAGADQSIQKQLGKFPQAGEVEVASEVRKGFPGEEILKVQEEKAIDLIVISALGRTGFARFFVGSVTNHVVKDAKCPVLLLK